VPVVRSERDGGGAPTDPEQVGATLTLRDEDLRPALEAAFLVVLRGARAKPPQPVPSSLRPYLKFQRLPTAALGPVRRALEDDEELRARVAAAMNEDVVGRVPWLWLTRPDGWEALVEEALQEEGGGDEAGDAAVRPSELERRLATVEKAARRAQADLGVARQEAERARADLTAERDERRAVEARLAKQEARAAHADEEVTALRRRLEQALVERDQAVEELQAARSHLVALDEALRAAEAARDRLVARVAALEGAATPTPELDHAGLAVAIERAGQAAAVLGTALGDAARLLVSAAPPVPGPGPGPGETAPSSTPVTHPVPTPGSASAGEAPRPVRRRPVPLPGGVFDDSPQAAEHLVRVPGAVLVVDGYNVTKTAWPELPPPEQRSRLLDALETLAARCGPEPVVVFDGADVEARPVPTAPRQRVRVRFSPPGVEADDVVVAMVDELPADRPVVVVSSDRRVRDGARARGANVLSTPQLLSVLRR